MSKTMATFLKRQTIWTFNHNRNILTTMTSLHYDDYDGWSNKSNRNNNHHRRFNKNNTFCCRNASTTTVRNTSSSIINSNKEQHKFIYTTQKGDTAGHMVGSSVEKKIRKNDEDGTIKTYSSFKDQWIEETDQSWPSKCSTKGCSNPPTLGAHIFINKKKYAYLVPMCSKCNNNRNNFNYKPNEMIDNHLKFPIPLDDGTPCVELAHLHISEQNTRANNGIVTWRQMFERFIAYTQKYNSPLVPYRYKNDPQLGRWVSNQRRRYKGDGFNPCQIKLLGSNGFVWDAWEHEWGETIKLLIKYKDREGHCNVPFTHKEDGKQLGVWFSRQRKEKKRRALDTVKEKQLEELGIVWNVYEHEWDENITLLIGYKNREGHCNVPQKHKEEDGKNLGRWVRRQRDNKKRGTLDTVKEKQLEELGIVWDVLEYEWDENITLLIEYKGREGNCNVPYKHREDGKNLGQWLCTQRHNKKRGLLDTEKEKQLKDIGIVWAVFEYEWDENIKLLMEYKQREGHCNVPTNYKEHGKKLGLWLCNQRQDKKKGTLDTEKEKQLKDIGIVWAVFEYEWDENIKLLMEYKQREGHCNVPYRHKEDEVNLGLWISRQRNFKRIGAIDTVKEKQLEDLGIVWAVFEYEWDENIKLLMEYKDREGHCNVPQRHKEDGKNLGSWLNKQRQEKKRGTLDTVKEMKLEELGFVWDALEYEWNEFSKLLIEYKHREGHCKVPTDHKEDGKNLGKWYSRQKHGKLSEVRQERLREISVIRDDPRTGTD